MNIHIRDLWILLFNIFTYHFLVEYSSPMTKKLYILARNIVNKKNIEFFSYNIPRVNDM